METTSKTEIISSEEESWNFFLSDPPSWILAGILPAFHLFSWADVFIFSGALLFGGMIVKNNPYRWIAFGWIVSIFYPTIPLLMIVACGTLSKNMIERLGTVLLGLFLFILPSIWVSSGSLLMTIGIFYFFWEPKK